MKKYILIIAAVVVLAVLFALFRKPASSTKPSSSGWTIYGSKECSWCKKQFEEMDSKGIDYKFVDCQKEECVGIPGFPTLKNDDGTVKVGFTPM
jgi:hypothetical protein